jgi:hypothetical protein
MNPSRVSVEKEGGSVTINAPFGIYEIVVLDSEKKKVDSFNLDGYKKEGTETDAMFRSGWLVVSFAAQEEQPKSVEVSFDSNDSNEKRVAYLRFLGLDQYGTVFIEQE